MNKARIAAQSRSHLDERLRELDPEATRAFLKTTHEKYQALFGAEFGNTVLGFFGDETDYNGFITWTPKLLEEFQKQKGYDLKPYIPMWFMGDRKSTRLNS